MSYTRACGILIAIALYASSSAAAVPTDVAARSQLPVSSVARTVHSAFFVENRGQFDARARFQLSGAGGTWWLTDDALWLIPPGDTADALRLTFDDADPAAQWVPLQPQAAYMNYFIGRDPTRWRTNVPTFGAVRWKGAARGADLVLSPGANGLRIDVERGMLSALRLRAAGADEVGLDAAGTLMATTRAGRFTLPAVYQDGHPLQAHMDGPAVTFSAAAATVPTLRFAPAALYYSTYLGGSAFDVATGIAVDAAGDAYVTGVTQSTDFPVDGTLFGTLHGSNDAFITKFVPSGGVMYSTFLGGSGVENSQGSELAGIAVDAAGSVYVTGGTTSADFPVVNAIQPVHGATTNSDVYVTKVNPWGNQLVYSTFLGAAGSDVGHGIAVDAAGSAYVVGEAGGGFPVMNPIQTFLFGTHAFVAKINPAGSALVYSTYLGGVNTAGDYGLGIAVDAAGNAYVTGRTTATDFPIVGGVQGVPGGGGYADAFITKFNAAGTAWVYSTYLGGSRTDEGVSIALDAAGNAYVTGETESNTDFPVANPFRHYGGGRSDAFVSKLNAAGNSLIYSTYLGGNGDENYSTNDVGGIAADAGGDAYVTGYTCSPDFPLLGSLQPYLAPRCFGFVSRFAADGHALRFSSLLGTTGGGGDTRANAIALGDYGSVYVTGGTHAPDFLVWNPWQPVNRGLGDAFVTRLTAPPQFVVYLPAVRRGP